MTPPFPPDVVADAVRRHLDALPPARAAALLGYVADLVAHVPPDDRSVLTALLARGALAPALDAWLEGNRWKAWARLDGAWAEELMRQDLPYAALPALEWPAVL